MRQLPDSSVSKRLISACGNDRIPQTDARFWQTQQERPITRHAELEQAQSAWHNALTREGCLALEFCNRDYIKRQRLQAGAIRVMGAVIPFRRQAAGGVHVAIVLIAACAVWAWAVRLFCWFFFVI